jgi:hypothetical protein
MLPKPPKMPSPPKMDYETAASHVAAAEQAFAEGRFDEGAAEMGKAIEARNAAEKTYRQDAEAWTAAIARYPGEVADYFKRLEQAVGAAGKEIETMAKGSLGH